MKHLAAIALLFIGGSLMIVSVTITGITIGFVICLASATTYITEEIVK